MKHMSQSEELLGRFAADGREFVGRVHRGEVVELGTSRMIDVITGNAAEGTGATHALDGLRVLPPVERPSKIICIGLNYRSHIKEMKWETPKTPIIFSKPSSAIIGDGDEIVLPAMSRRVDYEGETAVVVGARAPDSVSARNAVFGFTGFNDVTARDLQKTDPDWTRAKGFDTFAPIGPFISSRPPAWVATRLNGREVQRADTSDRVFDDVALVEYISRIMTLESGDIIATGTPSGISPMKPGDIVEVEADGVGVLRNSVVPGATSSGR